MNLKEVDAEEMNAPLSAWISLYVRQQSQALCELPSDKIASVTARVLDAMKKDRQIFVFGNGGSAANASHFVTDLGKSASDKLGVRFRCMSLNDNVPWITALANDFTYEDVFVRQLMNFAQPCDLVIGLSVSGNSKNMVKAFRWANEHDMETIAFVGGKVGHIGKMASTSIVINDEHYGRVEDAQMMICHMICYGIMGFSGQI